MSAPPVIVVETEPCGIANPKALSAWAGRCPGRRALISIVIPGRGHNRLCTMELRGGVRPAVQGQAGVHS